MANARTNEVVTMESGGDYQKIIDTPRAILFIANKARGRLRFYVRGQTPILIEDSDSYLPLAPSARVTRIEFIRYLTEIVESAERQADNRGVSLLIELSIHGNCYFI